MSTIRQLPIKDHYLAVRAQISTARNNFAMRDIPKAIYKTVIGWAETYVERKDLYSLDKLMERITNEDDRFLEDLAVLEGVPWEHLEECVGKTRAILLGVEA